MDWLSGYNYRRKITVDSTLIASTLTDFPVLVNLTDVNFDFSTAMSNGYDVRFTQADALTPIDFDREFHGQVHTYGADVLSGGTPSGDTIGGAWGNPEYVVDNNEATFGTSQDAVGDHWWQYDLGAGVTKTVTKLRMHPYYNAWGNSVKGFIVQGSNNAVDWTAIYTGEHQNTSASETYEFINTTAYRYYRLYFTTKWTAHPFAGLFEVEMMEYATSTNRGTYWVELPSISDSVDTDFYIYWGKSGDADGANGNNTWNAQYSGVWHLNQFSSNTIGEFIDSTSNNHHGQGQSLPTCIEGVVHKGQKGGSPANIRVPDSTDFDFGSDPFSIEFKLIFPTSVTTGSIMGHDNGSGGVPKWILNYGNSIAGNMSFHTNSTWLDWAWIPVADTSYHCVVTRSGSDWKFYVNGVQTGGTISNAVAVADASNYLTFLTDGEAWKYYAGILDEVRFSKGTAVDEPYISASYASDSDGLLSYNSEEIYAIIQKPASLEWNVSENIELHPSLEWVSKLAHKFIPNVINYSFNYEQPKIISSSVPVAVSGCTIGYSIYLGNTGSSGNTVIEIYSRDSLKATVTLVSDGTEYSRVTYFDLDDFLNPEDIFQIRVTDVAVDSSDLKINMYLMTFPFSLDKTEFGNIQGTTDFLGINGNYLFKNSDYWYIDFNQPLYATTKFVITDINGDTIDADYTIDNGKFYNSRLRITPYTTTTIENILVKIEDYNGKNYSFNFYPRIENNFSDYPSYVSDASIEVEIFLSATHYRYSFDAGVSWTSWTTVSDSNTMTVAFSEASPGDNTLTVQYLNGNAELEESVNIYYVTGEISCSVAFMEDNARIYYTDGVPLDKVELYYDDVLVDTFNIALKTGMTSIAVDTGAKTITPEAGYLYYNNKRYDWDGSAISVNPDFMNNNEYNRWRFIFGFNTVTNEFELKETPDMETFSNFDYDSYPNFISILAQKIVFVSTSIYWVTWSMSIAEPFVEVFMAGNIPFIASLDKDILVKIIDVTGRDKDFTYLFSQTKYNIWRTLSVTRSNTEESGHQGVEYGWFVFSNSASYWTSPTAGSLPQWVSYEFGQGASMETIVEYAISTSGYAVAGALPKSWKFQGSIDNVNWIDLDEKTGEVFSAGITKTYTILNTTAYAYYRLYITDSNAGVYVQVMECELHGSIGGVNLALADNAIELLPGQLHTSSELSINIESDDWELDSMNGV